MRAKPSTNGKSSRTNKPNGKPHGTAKSVVRKGTKDTTKKPVADLSVLRQPVDTSVSGLKQAVKVFETGTPEVLELLTYDCDVVYECKVCRNLFRSIANFISHKRVYCTLRYSRAQELHSNKEGGDFALILEEKAQERLPTRVTARKDLTTIVESLSTTNSLSGVCLQSKHNGNNQSHEKKTTTVHLEAIENTSCGVFQTILNPESENLMKNQVNELQKLLSQNEVVLGPDGKILQNGLSDLSQVEREPSNNDTDLICLYCNIKFSTRKTLSRHMRAMHQTAKATYMCPICKNCFANPWSVYRHLYRVHKKTSEQVRRLRAQIRKKELVTEKSIVNQTKKTTSPNKRKTEIENSEVQHDNKEWINHFEEDLELQRCGGCGRKFERKAALLSHAQICHKRIVACNRIELNCQGSVSNDFSPVVSLNLLPCSKKPVPKSFPEKKIGIQVRMNYCKDGSQQSDRQVPSRSVLGDDIDLEPASVDGKDNFNGKDNQKSSDLDNFFKKTRQSSDTIEKVQSYLNSSKNRIGNVNINEMPADRFKVTRSNLGQSKGLEAKCLQLRNALENSDTCKTEEKMKELEKLDDLDGNTDNTSESNTSAVSSLSGLLSPSFDKIYSCKSEQSSEIKNMISETSEKIPSSGSECKFVTNEDRLHTVTCETNGNKDTACNEVLTSELLDEASQEGSNCFQHRDVSPDLKCVAAIQGELNNIHRGNDLENTISILTRNQMKAICKDDVSFNKNGSEVSQNKRKSYDVEVESATTEIIKKKLTKYIDVKLNQCTVCNRRFKSKQYVYRHVRTQHTLWKRYECLFSGCNFQTFLKSSCLHHVTLHSKDGNGWSLVGKINPSKWDLKVIKTKNPNPPKTSITLKKGINKKDLGKTQALTATMVTPKLSKTLSSQMLKKTIVSKKLTLNVKRLTNRTKIATKLNPKENLNAASKKRKSSDVMVIVKKKQKLLTEFKYFNSPTKMNGIEQHSKKSSTKSVKPQHLKSTAKSSSQIKLKINAIPNGCHDEPEGDVTESGTSIGINDSEIVDSTLSLEEDESQESDRPVEDNQLTQIMEVIFGSPAKKTPQPTGRPVRNKCRPKRDNDFILGCQKECDKESVDGKSNVSNKTTKAPPSDMKSGTDSSKKPNY